MKNLDEMRVQQREFVGHLRDLTEKIVEVLDKAQIQTVLLSGSVGRGDYFPGKLGGYVDLVVMTKGAFDAEAVLGKDLEPEIPYHCVETEIDGEKIGFAVDVRSFVSVEEFKDFEEARKWSILEAVILYDEVGRYAQEMEKIQAVKATELKSYFEITLFGVERLVSEYMCDKWMRRGAYVQLHENLNKAVELAIHCLYYLNGSYVGPDNRLSYYTYSFERLPGGSSAMYGKLMARLMAQKIWSRRDFLRRKALFEKEFLSWLKAEGENSWKLSM